MIKHLKQKKKLKKELYLPESKKLFALKEKHLLYLSR